MTYPEVVYNIRMAGDVVEIKIPDYRIRGREGSRDINGILDDDLKLCADAKVGRDIDLGQSTVHETSGEKRGCALHGEGRRGVVETRSLLITHLLVDGQRAGRDGRLKLGL
jgi:hypothetical protein